MYIIYKNIEFLGSILINNIKFAFLQWDYIIIEKTKNLIPGVIWTGYQICQVFLSFINDK